MEWSYSMQAAMEEKELWSVVEMDGLPDDKAKLLGRKACAFIRMRIAPTQYHLVSPTATAKQAWDTLRQHHEVDTNRLFHIMSDLQRTKYGPGVQMAAHVQKYREYFIRFAKIGINFSSDQQAQMLLASLPTSDWRSTIDGFLTQQEALMFEKVAKRLIDREQQLLLEAESVKADTEKGDHGTAMTANQRMSNRRNIRCYRCDRMGHYQSECHQKPRRGTQNASNNSAGSAMEEQVSMMIIPEREEKLNAKSGNQQCSGSAQNWLVDSGASRHYCYERRFFDHLREESGNFVQVADGRRVEIKGSGDVRSIIHQGDGKKLNVVFRNVQYVPDMKENLLSVASMTAEGIYVSFDDKACRIMKAGRTVGVAKKIGANAYRLVTESQNQAIAAAVSEMPPDAWLQKWHRRLGHLNQQDVIKLFQQRMVEDCNGAECKQAMAAVSKQQMLCEPCVLGKQHHTAKPTEASTRATRPLELVHTDLCGPMQVPGRHGERYKMVADYEDDNSEKDGSSVTLQDVDDVSETGCGAPESPSVAGAEAEAEAEAEAGRSRGTVAAPFRRGGWHWHWHRHCGVIPPLDARDARSPRIWTKGQRRKPFGDHWQGNTPKCSIP